MGSVRFAVVFGALQLHLQAFHADLKAIHRLDGSLCRDWIVIANKTWKTQRGRKGGQDGVGTEQKRGTRAMGDGWHSVTANAHRCQLHAQWSATQFIVCYECAGHV